MKKNVFALVWICVLLVALAGCGNSNNANNASPAASGSAAPDGSESAAPSAEPVTIKVANWSPAADMEPIFQAYEDAHPGVTLEYVELADNGDSVAGMKKLDLLVASGENLDVVFMPGATDYSQRAGLGLLAPLNDLIAKEGITLTDEYTVDPSIDGQIYALPDTLENYFVLLNKDKLDAAGLAVPTDWTWDDYLDYSAKLTSGSGASKTFGTYFHTWAMYWELAIINQKEKNNLVTDGTVNIDSEGIRKSLELRSKAEESGVAVPYADTISQKLAYRSEFFTGHAAMIVTGNWMIGEAGGSEEFPATFTTAFAPMPSNASGDPAGVSIANGNYIGILGKSEHQQEAYDFVRWYSTEGEQMQNVYSAWKQQDVDQFIAGVKENAMSPDKIDEASLAYVIKNAIPAPLSVPPTYQGELEEAFLKETELYILKQQDLDTTISKAQAELQKIVDANK
ncbi:ABC transporter substrate-binding protein [Paenibacillus sp. S150]|uniref:ABC transporter substrate-binding protein n=1 Tax=Paenibacillus sp. S150 TaxID=2749826 RepID=UPI001C594544|nr:extracellular solute-binding protein [Paenibacillus sp. S150]MBW4082250.1 extracellular solute-binding protein [Paenibacillus sp. S150]